MGDDTETASKPITGPNGQTFESFDSCVAAMSDEDGIDDPEAFCAWLEQEGKEALNDPNAEEVLTGLEVEFVSAVDEPAQDSEWLIAKDAAGPEGDTHRWQSEVTLYVRKDHGDDAGDDADRDAKQVAFAPVLVPKEADKQGDVIPQPAIEDAAHKYLAEYRKVDSDHDLRDGKGTPVESWTLKQDTTFELPDGSESREYPEGTWVMGIKFDDDTWQRVVEGELSGLSIYGGAKPVDVDALLGKGTESQSKDAGGDADDGDPTGDDAHMATEDDDPGDTGNDDGEETTEKQLDAGMVSDMLATVGEKSGVTGDSTIKDFVKALIEDGDVDDSEVRNMSVLLDGGDPSGGDDMGDGDDGGGDDDEGVDLDVDTGEKSGDDADDGGDDVDKDTDDVEKSVSVDDVEGLDDVVKAVEELADEVEDLRADVDHHPDADRMEPATSDRIAKDLTGIDDADVARNAIREQVAKSDGDGDPEVDYEGITEGENAGAEAGGREHSAAANSRMVGGDN